MGPEPQDSLKKLASKRIDKDQALELAQGKSTSKPLSRDQVFRQLAILRAGKDSLGVDSSFREIYEKKNAR